MHYGLLDHRDIVARTKELYSVAITLDVVQNTSKWIVGQCINNNFLRNLPFALAEHLARNMFQSLVLDNVQFTDFDDQNMFCIF